jgi:hypothetical protein
MKHQHLPVSQVVVCKIRQPPLFVTQSLLSAISFHLLRVLLAIFLPIVRVRLTPLPSRPAGTPDRKRSSAGDNRGGVGSGMRGHRKPVVEDDKGQAERLADSIGNDDPSSGGSG